MNIEDPISMTKKPEVIQMHLDILYKSVGFLSKHKIERILDDYKRAKDQKQREEEERLRIQLLLKKSRGRQAKNKCKLLEEQLQDQEARLHNNQLNGEGCHIVGGTNDLGQPFCDKYNQNLIKTSCFMTEERRTTILQADEAELQNLGLNPQQIGN
jgi:superfamily II DNA or RNA helicase